MKNLSGNKLEKLVFGMFDQMVEGADKYVTKQGSTWLIFTEDKKWVIEFTKDKTLWFNFNLFQGELDLIGKDCTEERDLIKNWFESRFLNKPKVDETLDNAANMIHNIEDTIENGVKDTIDEKSTLRYIVEDTIQEGVKDTYHFQSEIPNQVEDAIQEGVKRTFDMEFRNQLSVEDTIQEGVKHTTYCFETSNRRVEDTIQNGVKEINHVDVMKFFDNKMEVALQNGVKVMMSGSEWYHQDEVEDLIEKRVKEDKN